MSKELPRPVLRTILVQDAAEDQLKVEQTFKLQDLPELQEILFCDAEDADFSVRMQASFSSSINACAELSLQLEGYLPVECQRCMGKLKISIAQTSDYVLVNSEKEAEKLLSSGIENHGEVLVLTNQESKTKLRDGQLDLSALVADELILGIPLYPRHEDIKNCSETDWVQYASEKKGFSDDNTEHVEIEKDVQRPFANLKDLIKHK